SPGFIIRASRGAGRTLRLLQVFPCSSPSFDDFALSSDVPGVKNPSAGPERRTGGGSVRLSIRGVNRSCSGEANERTPGDRIHARPLFRSVRFWGLGWGLLPCCTVKWCV